ncbi:uncharacterized protein LOC131258087 isoform X3 [Magnolia sinica]|uniref:uncharacterized protein LOC131258087 isoform X3 n=1 Tax=Magnolia sinica TaxID=86752 RepID=UPI002659100E|nr:uncharacterized protein LOC131258087 isoform X3 [Magnolia sinica]
MEKLFQKAVWACVLAFLVLLGSWFLMIDLRSTDFYTPLQGIATHRRGMEFSVNRVSGIPPPTPFGNRLRVIPSLHLHLPNPPYIPHQSLPPVSSPSIYPPPPVSPAN